MLIIMMSFHDLFFYYYSDGYDSADPTFILESEDDTTPGEIQITVIFNLEASPSSAFTVTFRNGILSGTMFMPQAYSPGGIARGLLGMFFYYDTVLINHMSSIF